MWETIQKWWVTWVMSGIAAVLAAAWAWLLRRLQAQAKAQAANTAGTLALLKDRLFQSCLHYLEKGYCDVHSRESLEALYEAYKAMGGNGTGTTLYERTMALPFKKDGDGR